jgi:hypothetical protein
VTDRPLSIVYVGPVIAPSPEFHTVCRMRAEALEQLGHEVTLVNAETPTGGWRYQLYRVGNRLDRPPDVLGTNRAILQAVRHRRVDVVWIDKGRSIRPATLRTLREISPGTLLLTYSPDDMMNTDNQSVQYRANIPAYDVHVTTKSYNVQELLDLGAREVQFVDNAYDPATHRPLELTEEERRRYATDVGFVGAYEQERGADMAWLAGQGVAIKIWGYLWDRLQPVPPKLDLRHEAVRGDEYAKAVVASKIQLGFLRKVNRDLQTTRSIEIPAIGTFMLAERSPEHRRLFEEGKEAEFFDSREELLEKCRYYLEHDEERRRIARAGRQRCIDGGYSNAERLDDVVARIRPAIERLRRAAG